MVSCSLMKSFCRIFPQFSKIIFLFISGESNVYTLGNIGPHRVVCTKLPTVGHTREAMIAAGNTTTRLLGIEFSIDDYDQLELFFLMDRKCISSTIFQFITYQFLFFVAGTFQKVDYVILVGVGGGVPHYTDYKKHVRLGDVVVSHPAEDKR